LVQRRLERLKVELYEVSLRGYLFPVLLLYRPYVRADPARRRLKEIVLDVLAVYLREPAAYVLRFVENPNLLICTEVGYVLPNPFHMLELLNYKWDEYVRWYERNFIL
jgi:hypothetical protein